MDAFLNMRRLSEEDLTDSESGGSSQRANPLPFFLLISGVLVSLVGVPLSSFGASRLTTDLFALVGTLIIGISIALVVLRVCPVRGIVRIVFTSLGILFLNPLLRLLGRLPGWTSIPIIGIDTPNNWFISDFCLLVGLGGLLWGFYKTLLELRAVWNRAECEREDLAREVLERKHALRALGESERMYREAIQVAGAVPYTQIYEPDDYPFMGPGIEEVIGIPPEEFNARWEKEILQETVFRGDLAGMSFSQAVQACRSDGKTWKADFRIRRPDGEERWLANSAVQVSDEQGRIIGCLGIMQDITDRKRTEEAILDREIEQRVFSHTLTALMGIGLELTRAESVDELCRQAIDFGSKRLGFRKLGIWFLDAIPGVLRGSFSSDENGNILDNRQRKVVLVEHLKDWEELEAMEPFVRHARCNPNLDPDDADLDWTISAPLWDGGHLVGLLTAKGGSKGQDLREHEGELFALFAESLSHLTARKRVEQALRENQRVFTTLLSNLPGMVYRCANDPYWTMEFISSGAFELTGYSPSEFLEKKVNFGSDIIHPDDQKRIWEEVQIALRDHCPFEITYRLVRADGLHRWAWERGTGVYDSDGNLVALEGFISDLTERIEAEQEKELLESQVRQSQKLESLGILAGGIAHDFNNLLVGILGHAGLAQSDLPQESPAREHMYRVEIAAQRAAELTQQMLAYSGRGKFQVEPVDLSCLVYELGQLLEVSISKKARLKYRLETELGSIEADASQIRQVVMNLITNASDALEDCEGVIIIRTGMRYLSSADLARICMTKPLREGDYVFVEVTDSGCGMDSATQARIFDPFFTTKFAGRGLGLAAVLGIVRGHHGTLEVESQAGRGTTFRAYFPKMEAKVTKPIELVPEATAWLGKGTILVVDDEEIVRKLATISLERSGFAVVQARDGKEAISIFEEDPTRFDAVLLDMTMPLMSGEETFGALRAIHPDVRVILSSGYSESQTNETFTGSSPCAFLQKPYKPADLISRVRQVIETDRSEPPLGHAASG